MSLLVRLVNSSPRKVDDERERRMDGGRRKREEGFPFSGDVG